MGRYFVFFGAEFNYMKLKLGGNYEKNFQLRNLLH